MYQCVKEGMHVLQARLLQLHDIFQLILNQFCYFLFIFEILV